MEEFFEIVFKMLCVIATVFATLSTNPRFLVWVGRLGVTKWKKTSYQSYMALCMVMVGWIVIYSGAISLLTDVWELIFPTSVLLTLIALHGLNKSKEQYEYIKELENTKRKNTSV